MIASLTGNGSTATDFVVLDLRLARALCAVTIGAALGASGAAFQALTRNPLGSPDIIGFTSGAATGALLQILIIGGTSLAIAGGALVGGLATALLVYLLSAGRGAVGYRLILVGIGLNAMLWAVNSYLLVTAKLRGRDERPGVAGRLAERPQLGPALAGAGRRGGLPAAADGCVPAAGTAGDGRRRREGAGGARGADPDRRGDPRLSRCAPRRPRPPGRSRSSRWPRRSWPRRLTGSVAVSVLPAALMGAFVLITSDLVAQRLFAPVQLPVGIATGAVGGLYLVWLLLSEWKKGRG